MPEHADILLVTATKTESQAVLAVFKESMGKTARPVTLDERIYRDLGEIQGARVFLVQSEMGSGGLGAAQQTAQRGIASLSPSYVIMVGIAFGVDAEKQSIGDILVSTQLSLYELQRVGTQKRRRPHLPDEMIFLPRGAKPDASPALLNRLRSADLEWQGAKVRFGVVLSGEKLVDNLDFREQLKAFEPEAVGGEMEGAGLYTACQERKVDWILVKGICDWADGNKAENKEHNQAVAARNAAAFVLHALLRAPFEPIRKKNSSGSQSGNSETKVKARKIQAKNVLIGGRNVTQTNVDVHNGGKVIIESQDVTERQVSARRRYLERLWRTCQALPLSAMGGEDETDAEVSLDNVYIELDTTTQVSKQDLEAIKQGNVPKQWKKKMESQTASESLRNREFPNPVEEAIYLPALDAARVSPRLALLGDPGAGKSTFVRYLSAWLAAANLGRMDPPEGFPHSLIPVIVTLRDLTGWLGKLDLDSLPNEEQSKVLAEGMRNHIQSSISTPETAAYTEELLQVLHDGDCLLVLDGLDEVPQALRGRIRQAVTAVIHYYKPKRIILTCRIRSYTGEAVLPGFDSFTLAHFDQPKIRRFARLWYQIHERIGRLDAEQANTRAQDLARAAISDDLRDLAVNPMMLTSMAIIHQKEIGLPRERVVLYHLLVDVLLNRWQKGKLAVGGLAGFLKDNLRLLMIMERLAYEAHRNIQSEKSTSDLSRGDILTLLETPEYLGDVSLAAQFLDYVDQRAGLLLGRGGDPSRPTLYSFPHRILQEYLAGCYLAGQRNLARSFYALAGEGDYWNLAVQLAFEELYYNRRGTNTLLDLAYCLCAEAVPIEEGSFRATLWAGEIVTLLGREIVERDAENPGSEKNFLERLLPRLVLLLSSGLNAPERADAGRLLAKLGDPRLEVTSSADIAFCFVPQGPFWMGEGKQGHPLELPAFWITRFPITNQQYKEFTQSNGYQQPGYWQEAIPAGAWRDGKVIRKYPHITGGQIEWAEEVGDCPYDFGEPFNLPNHPVVGITWYEALAYTRWLEEVLRQKAHILPLASMAEAERRLWEELHQGTLTVSLPSEAEWEKAARVGLPSPPTPLPAGEGKEQIYPWGKEFDANKANTSETGIGATSAVGCFPGGKSHYGVEELSGNVWEWTRSLSGDYPYPGDQPGRAERENLAAPKNIDRVLRGGAFSYVAQRARCAVRLRNNPGDWYWDLGFRVVVLPK